MKRVTAVLTVWIALMAENTFTGANPAYHAVLQMIFGIVVAVTLHYPAELLFRFVVGWTLTRNGIPRDHWGQYRSRFMMSIVVGTA